jgi:hypothetical protein
MAIGDRVGLLKVSGAAIGRSCWLKEKQWLKEEKLCGIRRNHAGQDKRSGKKNLGSVAFEGIASVKIKKQYTSQN